MSKPDPLDFPEPDRWATYMTTRSPNFKTHKTLGQCKNALSGKCYYMGPNHYQSGDDMWVYEWDQEEHVWVERFAMKRGERKEGHPLWQTRVPRSGHASKEVPQKVLDKAIASIMKAAQ